MVDQYEKSGKVNIFDSKRKTTLKPQQHPQPKLISIEDRSSIEQEKNPLIQIKTNKTSRKLDISTSLQELKNMRSRFFGEVNNTTLASSGLNDTLNLNETRNSLSSPDKVLGTTFFLNKTLEVAHELEDSKSEGS